MADEGFLCDGCQQIVGSCVETLPCGHFFCGGCSPNMKALNTLCALCEGCEADGGDILNLCDETSDENDFALNFREVVVLDEDVELDKQCDETETKDFQYVLDHEAASGHSKDNLHNALVFAKDTLYRLRKAMQTMKSIEGRKTLLEENIAKQIHEEFNKLSNALKERKSTLFARLRNEIGIYNTNLEKAAQVLEKLTSNLEEKVKFAEGLNDSPSVSMYCDINQLIADLEVNVDSEEMIESVKVLPNIRFSICSDIIIDILETAGNIHNENVDGLPTLGKCSLVSTKMDTCSSDVNSLILTGMEKAKLKKDRVQMSKKYQKVESNIQMQLESNESDHQKLSFLSSKVGFLPKKMSSPDVIIEQIIVEDEQSSDSSLPGSPKTSKFPFSNRQYNFLQKVKPELPREASKTDHFSCKSKKFKSQKKIGLSAPLCQKKSYSDLVYLSHVISPCSFYVHRLEHKRQLIMMEHMLNRRSRAHRRCSPLDAFELGEMVCFRSVERETWCRGKITNLIPSESKYIQKNVLPNGYCVDEISRLTIFLIDYGSSETFIVSRYPRVCIKREDLAGILETKVPDLCNIVTKLSPEDDNLRLAPPFALHCSLNVTPPTPNGIWTKEAKNQMLSVVKNKCVQMKVIREENEILIVDLKKPGEKKIASDMPVSLRDSLIFLDLAKFPSNIVNAASPQFNAPISPQEKADVLVCHTNNPSDFYIQVIGDSEYSEVNKVIQDVYNSEEANALTIVSPVLGQACVAKYELDDDWWYRAQIIALPNSYEAEIHYVDFGNVGRVNVASLRMLKDEFLPLPRKAISCRLAYIAPFGDADQWSSEACNLFDKLTTHKHLKCSSIGVFLENRLSVELFDCSSDPPISINIVLVEKKVASFIDGPPAPVAAPLPVKEVWDMPLDQEQGSEEKPTNEPFTFERKELEVYISHVVSPGKIFVQWLTSGNILKSLESNMHEKYEHSKPESVDWQIDMYVAVQLPNNKKWRRGKITGIVSKEYVEVFCYDFGMDMVVNVASLRTLDEGLKQYGATCLECALMDIQPAGGCNKWTATACDFICHYLNGATVTMIIEENAAEWPLPVRILSKNEAGQLVDVSDFLINKGLALRDRRLKTRNPNPLMESKTTADASTSMPEIKAGPKLALENEVAMKENNTAASEESSMEENLEDPYLPPAIPSEKYFSAKVTHVADDGTIYVMQECLENDLGELMLSIQNSVKGLGLLAPYNWKAGEGCLIKGLDTMFYRGRILELLGGDLIKVHYVDFGFTEQIPKCHLQQLVFSPSVPRLCIPCRLVNVIPVGVFWQQDAVQFLNELLKERYVNVNLVETPTFPGDTAAVCLYCGDASVSAILQENAYCIPDGVERKAQPEIHCATEMPYNKEWDIDCTELLQSDVTPILPHYSLLSLPSTGAKFPVKATHVETPDKIFICIENSQLSALGDGDDIVSDCETLEFHLDKINSEADSLPRLTDFRTDMPCLGFYTDGLLHRAKLVRLYSCHPVSFLVEFVDYGTPAVLETSRLFELPAYLIKYPARAIKVKLAGYTPPKDNAERPRIPYAPEWSFEALKKMLDLLEGRSLSAMCVPGAPENTVFLYDEEQKLVHKPLIKMGLAEEQLLNPQVSV